MEVSTRSDEKQSTERNMTQDKGGDVYLELTSTHRLVDPFIMSPL
jgi:hypothetical protein